MMACCRSLIFSSLSSPSGWAAAFSAFACFLPAAFASAASCLGGCLRLWYGFWPGWRRRWGLCRLWPSPWRAGFGGDRIGRRQPERLFSAEFFEQVRLIFSLISVGSAAALGGRFFGCHGVPCWLSGNMRKGLSAAKASPYIRVLRVKFKRCRRFFGHAKPRHGKPFPRLSLA